MKTRSISQSLCALIALAVFSPVTLVCSRAVADDRPAAQAIAPDTSMDQVLDSLERRGKTLKDFTAAISLTQIDPDLGSSTTRTGHAWLQKQSDDDARLHVVLDKKLQGRLMKSDKVEYLLDGGWLIDRDYTKTIEVKRQVIKPGEKMNLLKLGEGPFPLPIGQDKRDVHRLFDVKKTDPAKDDPPGSIHLQLLPKPDSRLARRFSSIDVWVDRTSSMPVRIDTLDSNKTSQQRTEFSDLHVNPSPSLTDADFTLSSIDKDNWSRRTEPYGE